MTILSTALIVTPIIILALILIPVLKRRFLPMGRYVLWIAIMIVLALPIAQILPEPAFEISIPMTFASSPDASNTLEFANHTTQPTNIMQEQFTPPQNTSTLPLQSSPAPQPETFTLIYAELEPTIPLFLIIWIVGSLVFFGYQIIKYAAFKRTALKACQPIYDPLFDHIVAQMGISKKVLLIESSFATSPMLLGIFAPKVILPCADYSHSELELIYRHELTHLKRGDLWFKLALMTTQAVYWFNPAVHLMARQANKDIEMICDAKTIQGMDPMTKKSYSQLILAVSISKQMAQPFGTNMNGGKKMLKERIANIFDTPKKSGMALFAGLGIVVIASALLVGVDFAASQNYGDGYIYAQNDIIAPNYEDDHTPAQTEPTTTPQPTSASTPSASEINRIGLRILQPENYISFSGLTSNIFNALVTNNEIPRTPSPSFNVVLYHYDIDILHTVVFNEPLPQHFYFDNISSIDLEHLSSIFHLQFEQGDQLSVRYNKFVDNWLAFEAQNGVLSVSSHELPLLRETSHESITSTRRQSSNANVDFIATNTLGNQTRYSDEWFWDLLEYRGYGEFPAIVITLPPSVTHINSLNNSITIANMQFANTMHISSVNGSINILNTVFPSAQLGSVNGFVHVTNSSFVSLTASSVNGSVHIFDSLSSSYDVSSVNGDVLVANSAFINLNANTVHGDINLELQGSWTDYNLNWMSNARSPFYTLNNERMNTDWITTHLGATSNLTLRTTSGAINITTQE